MHLAIQAQSSTSLPKHATQRKQQGGDKDSSPTWQQHEFNLEEEPSRTNFL